MRHSSNFVRLLTLLGRENIAGLSNHTEGNQGKTKDKTLEINHQLSFLQHINQYSAVIW